MRCCGPWKNGDTATTKLQGRFQDGARCDQAKAFVMPGPGPICTSRPRQQVEVATCRKR